MASEKNLSSWIVNLLGKIFPALIQAATALATFFLEKNKNKKERNAEIKKYTEEIRRGAKAEERVEIYKEQIEESKRIINEANQLEVILQWHEFTKEQRISLIDRNVSLKQWMENKEVRNKLKAIKDKQDVCKGCETCNPLSYEFLPLV